MNFPVFYTSIRPLGSKGRARVVVVDVPVRGGDVLVHPGHAIFVDFDGVVAIPQSRLAEVHCLAKRKIEAENVARVELQAGHSLHQVCDRH